MAGKDKQAGRETPVVPIVDDDPCVRETMGSILALKGFAVATAENGEDALNYLSSRPPPACTLCDLTMPVMDCHEFAQHKNADPVLNAVPLIIVSGVANLVENPDDLHAVALVSKPVDFSRLLSLIQGLCSL